MAGTLADGYVRVRPDTKGFAPALHRDLSGVNVSSAGAKVGSTFMGGMRRMVGIGMGLLAVSSAIDFVKQSIQQGRDAEKADRLVAQAIKATGREAQFSVKSIDARANALMAQVGVDDEVIKSGMTLMLSFKNVRNQVGQGADVFDRANRMALDMGQALGLALPNATRVLGKALNDPLKGMTALQRVGVTFNQQQKDQIKNWVAHGQTLKAQEFILTSLEGRFKGMAKAAADPATRARVAWGEFQEEVGKKLLPVVNAVAGWFADTALPAVLAFGNAVGKAFGWVGDLVTYVKALFTGTDVGVLAEGVQQAGDVIFDVLNKIGATTAFQWLADGISKVITVIRYVIDLFRGTDTASANMTAGMQQIGDTIHGYLVGAFDSLKQVLGAVWAGIQTFATGVVTGFKSIREAVNSVLTVVLPIIGQFVSGMAQRIQPFLPMIQSIFGMVPGIIKSAWDAAAVVVRTALTVIGNVIKAGVLVVQFIWQNWGKTIMDTLGTVFGGVVQVIQGAFRIIKGVFDLFRAIFTGNWSAAWNAIKDILFGAWEAIKGIIGAALGIIQGAISAAWTALQLGAKLAWKGLGAALDWAYDTFIQPVIDGFNLAIGTITSAFWTMKQGVEDAWNAMIRWLERAKLNFLIAMGKFAAGILRVMIWAFQWQPSIKTALTSALGAVNRFVADQNRALDHLNDEEVNIHTHSDEYLANFLRVGARKAAELAEGGPVRGPGTGKSDSVWFRGSSGEHVLTADEVSAAGGHAAIYRFRKSLRTGSVSGFAIGGPVFHNRISGWNAIAGGVGVTNRDMATAARNIGYRWSRGVEAAIQEYMESMGPDIGGRGVQRWAPTVLAVLRRLGQSAGWLSTVLRRMNQESGGNPYAVNKSDSNWYRGTPSVGLMQVIGPTFRAYANGYRGVGPFMYGTSVNPFANVFAGLNYAQHVYGSLAALNRPGGYDLGGLLRSPLNGTGRPERVLSPEQTAAFERLVTMLEQGSIGQNIKIDNHYPISEPTSVTVNRALQFAAALGR